MQYKNAAHAYQKKNSKYVFLFVFMLAILNIFMRVERQEPPPPRASTVYSFGAVGTDNCPSPLLVVDVVDNAADCEAAAASLDFAWSTPSYGSNGSLIDSPNFPNGCYMSFSAAGFYMVSFNVNSGSGALPYTFPICKGKSYLVRRVTGNIA